MSCVKHIVAAFIPVLFCVACGDTAESDFTSADQTTDELASTQPEESRLAGTYERTTFQVGELAQLVLKTDFTYHAGKVVACLVPPCNPVTEDGWYRLSILDRQNYLTLHNSWGNVVGRYQYELRESTLALRRLDVSTGDDTAEGGWFSMPRSTTSWCAVSSDCDLQNLPNGPCAGRWGCDSSVCAYSCLPVSAN